MATRAFWEGKITIDLPDTAQIEPGDARSIYWSPAQSSEAFTRLELFIFHKRHGTFGQGRAHVRKIAQIRGVKPISLAETTLVICDDPADTNGSGFDVRMWYVGGVDRMAILTTNIPQADRGAGYVAGMIAEADRIARSVKFPVRITFDDEVLFSPPTEAAAEPVLRPITPDEEAAINQLAERGLALLDQYAPDDLASQFERLDIAYPAALKEQPSANVLDAFGTLFGELLNGFDGSVWVAIDNGQDVTFGVRDERRDKMAFTLASLHERATKQQTNFFATLRKAFESEGA